jgi:hypothetical protein
MTKFMYILTEWGLNMKNDEFLLPFSMFLEYQNSDKVSLYGQNRLYL